MPNDIEMASYRSLCSSIGWIGIAASPFCAFYASYLQQKVPACKVRDLIWQINAIKHLQRLGSTIQFVRPTEKKEYQLSVVVFSDASRKENYGQLGVFGGLLIGDLKKGSAFHALSWSWHKSSRPVKSIGAAEILGSGEAIDEGNVLAKAYETLLGIEIDLSVIAVSKDLYDTLSTCRNSTDRSIRADSVIRYEFETEKVNSMIWIPGKLNIADALTKPNSSTTEMLQLAMYSGNLPIDFNESLSRQSKQSTG